MATVSTQDVPAAGSALTYASASGGGDRFLPGDGVFMHIVNGSGSSITATLATPGTVDGLAIADRAVAVPAGDSRLVTLPADTYRSSDGYGDVTWSATTTVTFAVLRVS